MIRDIQMREGVKLPPAKGEKRVATCQQVSCSACEIRALMLFSGLNETQVADLSLEVDECHFPPKSTLFEEKKEGDYLFSIKQGLVKLVRHSPSGEKRILRLLGQGSVIGIELLAGEPCYTESAFAISDTYACQLPLMLVRKLEQQCIGIVDRLSEQWQQQLHFSERTLVELSTGPVRKRVIRLIRLLVEMQGNQYEKIWMLTTEDVASIIGASVESASHVVAELKREKTITRVAPHIFRVDKRALSRQ